MAHELTEDLLARILDAAPGLMYRPRWVADAVGIPRRAMRRLIAEGLTALALDRDGVQPGEHGRLCMRLVRGLGRGREAMRAELLAGIREAAQSDPEAAEWLAEQGLAG